MIWFILAFTIALVAGCLVAADEHDAFEGFLAFAFTAFIAGMLATLVNIGVSAFVDDKIVDTKAQKINGPVFITLDRETGLLSLNLDAEDRTRYTDDAIQAEFRDSPERTFFIRDYQLGNKWLSLFNWESDHIIINIPTSESVELTRK